MIAATNRDLRQEIRNGRFRADLYHRLSVFTIDVPPLRDLGEDKRMLLDHFREFYARQARAASRSSSTRRALTLWLDYSFPGNVRELRNIVIRLTTKYAGQDGQRRAAAGRARHGKHGARAAGARRSARTSRSVLEAAKQHLQRRRTSTSTDAAAVGAKATSRPRCMITHGNLSQAAKLLGIHRTTLYSRMQNYGIADEPRATPD